MTFRVPFPLNVHDSWAKHWQNSMTTQRALTFPDWFMRWEHQWIINEAAEQISQFGQNHLSTTTCT